MVAFVENTEAYANSPPRARGPDRRRIFGDSLRRQPNESIEPRIISYTGHARLGSCSKDPIGYFDYQSLYYAGFALRGTDPTGFSTFIHPGDIDSLDGCKKWEQERMADCYGLLGPIFVNNEYLECIKAVRKAAKDCKKRNFMKDGGIFICTRNVREDAPCSTAINKCGGQHTYIQFGATDEDGKPCEGTTGCGFSGGTVEPGITLPSEEKAFKPGSCTRLNLPEGMSNANAEDCIRNYAIQHKYSTPSYNCGHWANDAVDHCGLSKGESVSF